LPDNGCDSIGLSGINRPVERLVRRSRSGLRSRRSTGHCQLGHSAGCGALAEQPAELFTYQADPTQYKILAYL